MISGLEADGSEALSTLVLLDGVLPLLLPFDVLTPARWAVVSGAAGAGLERSVMLSSRVRGVCEGMLAASVI